MVFTTGNFCDIINVPNKTEYNNFSRSMCIFINFLDKNTDALLLHVLRVVKGFVWRQLELRIFCASAQVGALFILYYKKEK